MQALWMVLGAFFFATMAVCVKFASVWFNSAELVCYRGLVSIVLVWLLARHQRVTLATAYPVMHLQRGAIGAIGLGLWFYAIAGLPMATAMTLNYMSSVWIAALLLGAGLLARLRGTSTTRGQWPLALAVLAGFVGVVMTLQPTIDQDQLLAGLMGLISGFTAAIAYMTVMAMGRLGEPEIRVVFYFSVGSMVVGALGMVVGGVSPWAWPQALWLLPIGLLASLGQLCMTRAYNHGATLVVACLHYCGIVFGAIFGLTLLGDDLPLIAWLGMGLIIISGIAATALRGRAAPPPSSSTAS